jgi:hypothetical protein
LAANETTLAEAGLDRQALTGVYYVLTGHPKQNNNKYQHNIAIRHFLPRKPDMHKLLPGVTKDWTNNQGTGAAILYCWDRRRKSL